MQLYKTRAAIRLAERAVIGRTWLWEGDGVPPDGRLIALVEELLVAPWLVQAGLKVIWQRLVWMAVLTSIVACAFWFIEPSFRQEMVVASFIVGATCVYFGLPSRTIFSGLSAKSVASLTKQLNSLSESSAEMDGLERGVQLIKAQSVDRLGRFNVFAGILWAAFFWFVGSRLLPPSVSTEVFRESAVPAVFGGAAFFALMSVSAAYAVCRANCISCLRLCTSGCKSQHCRHLTRNLQAWDVGCAGKRVVESLAPQDVRAIHPAASIPMRTSFVLVKKNKADLWTEHFGRTVG